MIGESEDAASASSSSMEGAAEGDAGLVSDEALTAPGLVAGPTLGPPSLAEAPLPSDATIGSTYDPSPAREFVRGTLAVSLVASLIVLVFVSLLIVWFKPGNTEELSEILQLILAPLVGLVGAATGFYYGTRQT